MSDSAPPPLTLLPFNDPPSIETSVQEHLNVVHEMRELREGQRILNENHQRLANAITVDRVTLGRVEKKIDKLLAHLGVRHG